MSIAGKFWSPAIKRKTELLKRGRDDFPWPHTYDSNDEVNVKSCTLKNPDLLGEEISAGSDQMFLEGKRKKKSAKIV